MAAELPELLNDVSLTLVMADPALPSSIADLLDAIKRIQSSDGVHPRVVQSCETLLGLFVELPIEGFLAIAKTFVHRAEAFTLSPETAVLLFEEDEDLAACGLKAANEPDISDDLDVSLLVEYIEKHVPLFDELEAAVVDAQFKLASSDSAGIAEEFNSFAKRYIHTLKGDSGSIGLIGIERVCHSIEELALRQSFATLLEPLLTFKEWFVAQMQAITANEVPNENSHRFLSRFRSLASAHLTASSTSAAHAAEQPQTPAPTAAQEAAPSGAVIELTAAVEEPMQSAGSAPASPAVADEPYINHELLAELLSSPSSALPDAPVATAPAAPDPSMINQELLAELMSSPGDLLSNAPATAESAPTYQMSGESDLFLEFAAEAEDHLGSIETTILESEGKYTKDSIDLIFRGIHSIKGASSYFSLKEIAESSHGTENLLDEVRNGSREFDQALTDLVLMYGDLQKTLLRNARQALSTGGIIARIPETDAYLKALKSYTSGGSAAANEPADFPAAPAAEPRGAEKALPAAAGGEKLDVKSFVKVETLRLDQLIDTIGEMCIYSSMLIQNTRAHLASNEQIIKITHQVEKFVRDLQNIGMSMRLIPIRGLFQKMSRLVWDTAKRINKDVRFETTGEDTELDRNIIEKLADPLMHMVRNAVDHGIETPDERVKAGKPRTGTVTLSAFHAGGSIHVQLRDDGKGLDPAKLIAKAMEKRIIQPNAVLSRSEAFDLIFAPGFSTAAVVTDISGRGVGMDVVRRNIEGMRGRVHIESELGKGTTFTIELPLTLAIIDGIEVAVADQRYIIPTLSVVEFMRPGKELITHTLDRGETFHFRGKYLPVYRLDELFGHVADDNRRKDEIFIVVESGGQLAAIVVDDIIGSYSTVIKGLGEMFSEVEGVAGCAIVSTGDVSLILDVRSLLSHARRTYSFRAVTTEESLPAVH